LARGFHCKGAHGDSDTSECGNHARQGGSPASDDNSRKLSGQDEDGQQVQEEHAQASQTVQRPPALAPVIDGLQQRCGRQDGKQGRCRVGTRLYDPGREHRIEDEQESRQHRPAKRKPATCQHNERGNGGCASEQRR
jgi:hypothetical protein